MVKDELRSFERPELQPLVSGLAVSARRVDDAGIKVLAVLEQARGGDHASAGGHGPDVRQAGYFS